MGARPATARAGRRPLTCRTTIERGSFEDGGYDVDVVLTTIGDGACLDHLARSALAVHQRVRLIVIADRRTPPELWRRCEEVAAMGVAVWAPDLDEQRAFMERLGRPHLVPWNSDNRRNVGFLLAYGSGTTRVISVDDDNLPLGRDFFEGHAVVSQRGAAVPVVDTASGWYNACALLVTEPVEVFPRGFPYARREPSAALEMPPSVGSRVDVAVNEGLWLGSLDVDAVTRLTVRATGSGLRHDGVALGRRTWCPVNSQNTALRREALPAYYFVRMGQVLDGLPVDRFGDIFSGYFVQACAKHLDHVIRFGTPLTLHRRNPHVILTDLRQEVGGILLLDDFCEWLTSCRLQGSSYREAYACLCELLADYGGRQGGAVGDFFGSMARDMREWLAAIDSLA